ncbi:nucleoside hydrolase [Segetibacter sp.]|jgi:purine nucleosidase|uniref:nucleoside hydrolase n=1 Tax=Segetibacter sp. TaxID=2231182 RepID=UPI00260393B5|nr:nucleoside hydrolase [Segetibacter sp.]MCW3080628.1 inosine/uridine-preferring nucleoside hydrolase [Segetibacter sp.]
MRITILRVCLIIVGLNAIGATAQSNNIFDTSIVKPRCRVIIDNDFSGDPDGLFQLVHHLLSPSVDVRAIIGSHLNVRDGFDNSKTQADNAAKQARQLVKLVRPKFNVPVIAGSNIGMANDSTPVKSEAVQFIIKEALRTDTKDPLYVVCGAGLTEIASALLTRPEIAEKITLVWIGGAEYIDLAFPPPNYSSPEYNLNIDINAGKVIFNKSSVALWQVPRNAYRQCLLSYAQLIFNVKSKGEVGKYLAGKIEDVMKRISKFGLNIGETYVLGDSPLVLLTALQSSFEADPSSSKYVIKMAPKINDRGDYEFNEKGRNIRVYDWLDTNLMFNDFFAKLSLFRK